MRVEIENAADRPTTQLWNNEAWETVPIYSAGDTIKGTMYVTVPKGKSIDHKGIRIDLIGYIELSYDKGARRELSPLTLEKEGPGDLTENKQYPFEFKIPKHDETYYGLLVQLRYMVRGKVRRAYGAGVEATKDFAIQNITPQPTPNPRIKMEVGIEDCLHIEFEYQRSKYALTDVILGKIYFLRVKIKVKHMELVLIRREQCGSGSASYNENDTLGKFEIMQGAPVRGEVIPVRLFLQPFHLTPTYRSVHNVFTVRYYLNLVLVDEEDRRYFKQQEIILWRDRIGDPTSTVQLTGANTKPVEKSGLPSPTPSSPRELSTKDDGVNFFSDDNDDDDQYAQ